MSSGFKFLEHTADVYVRVWGDSLERVFEEAARALYEVMTDPRRVDCIVEREVVVEGFDLENLLVRWLEELLFYFDSEGFIGGRVVVDEVSKEAYKVKARVCGEVFNPEKHESRTHVKAATYSQIKLWSEGERWYAEFVLDV